jgi:hypothetical protein
MADSEKRPAPRRLLRTGQEIAELHTMMRKGVTAYAAKAINRHHRRAINARRRKVVH